MYEIFKNRYYYLEFESTSKSLLFLNISTTSPIIIQFITTHKIRSVNIEVRYTIFLRKSYKNYLYIRVLKSKSHTMSMRKSSVSFINTIFFLFFFKEMSYLF